MNIQRCVGYLFCVGILSFSCINIREIPLPESPEVLVVNAVFSPDSSWKITLNQTTNSTTDARFFLPYIEDGTVELWEDGQYLGKLIHTLNGNYIWNDVPQVGKIYKMRAYAEGFDTVYASSYLPQYPDQMEVIWEKEETIEQADRFGGVFDTTPLLFDFEDPKGEDNFYLFGTAYYDSCTCLVRQAGKTDTTLVDPLFDRLKTGGLYANVSGATFDNDERRLLISDETFQGQNKRINVTTPTLESLTSSMFIFNPRGSSFNSQGDSILITNTSVADRIFITLYADTWSLSEDLHQYLSSYFIQGTQTSDPFASFQNVYSNVEGGLGIFAGYQRKLLLLYTD